MLRSPCPSCEEPPPLGESPPPTPGLAHLMQPPPSPPPVYRKPTPIDGPPSLVRSTARSLCHPHESYCSNAPGTMHVVTCWKRMRGRSKTRVSGHWYPRWKAGNTSFMHLDSSRVWRRRVRLHTYGPAVRNKVGSLAGERRERCR